MTIGLLQAIDDPDLLGAGFVPFPRQRDLLEQLDRGPRTQVWCIGRRGGKSLCGAAAAVWHATMRPDLDALVRLREVRYAVCVATNISQARIFVRAAKSLVEASPILSGLISGMNEDSISFLLPSGARTCIAAFPSSSRGGRGWPISLLFLDEAAFMRDDSSTDDAQVAGRIYSALAPSTAQFAGLARIVISSTPNGDSGFFAEMVEKSRRGRAARLLPNPPAHLGDQPDDSVRRRPPPGRAAAGTRRVRFGIRREPAFSGRPVSRLRPLRLRPPRRASPRGARPRFGHLWPRSGLCRPR